MALADTATLVDTARRIGATLSPRPAADAVDREARFPHEAIAALREERMLGALSRGARRPRRDDRRRGGDLRNARPILRRPPR